MADIAVWKSYALNGLFFLFCNSFFVAFKFLLLLDISASSCLFNIFHNKTLLISLPALCFSSDRISCFLRIGGCLLSIIYNYLFFLDSTTCVKLEGILLPNVRCCEFWDCNWLQLEYFCLYLTPLCESFSKSGIGVYFFLAMILNFSWSFVSEGIILVLPFVYLAYLSLKLLCMYVLLYWMGYFY